MLHTHHHTEEHIMFPSYAGLDGGKYGGLETELKGEHDVLIKDLDELIAVAKGEPTKETYAKVKELVTRMDEFLEPHFKKEETTYIDAEYTKDVTEEFFRKTHATIMTYVRANDPPPATFPFIVFGMPLEERPAFAAQLPWFLRVILFPIWASKYGDAWEYSPYVTKGTFTRFSFY